MRRALLRALDQEAEAKDASDLEEFYGYGRRREERGEKKGSETAGANLPVWTRKWREQQTQVVPSLVLL